MTYEELYINLVNDLTSAVTTIGSFTQALAPNHPLSEGQQIVVDLVNQLIKDSRAEEEQMLNKMAEHYQKDYESPG